MSESAPGFEKHPDYQVDITPTSDHLQIFVAGRLIADSRQPLRVTESKHHPVWYLPMADVTAGSLLATEHSTYCPFKGHASYWSITGHDSARESATSSAEDVILENSVWGYQTPYLECASLIDHVSFYTDRVELHVNGELQSSQGPGWTD